MEWRPAQLLRVWDLGGVLREAQQSPESRGAGGSPAEGTGVGGGHFLPPPFPQSCPPGSPGLHAEPGPARMLWAHRDVKIP